jgi:hypothetical protein
VGEAAGCDDVTVFIVNVAVDERRRTQDVLETKDAYFKAVDWLDEAGDGRIEGLVVDDGRVFKELVN